MNKKEKIAHLRHSLAQAVRLVDRRPIPLGLAEADAVLGGGIRPGALHEIHVADWCAGGFAALLALRVAGSRPVFWVCPDYEGLEFGHLNGRGWRELGGDPARLYLLRVPNAAAALMATADIIACPQVGAVVTELSGQPRCLDLTASRKLALAADRSGVTSFLLREAAHAEPGAAQTRWSIQAATGTAADDWGAPTLDVALTRNRGGGLGRWTLEWDSQHGLFHEARRDQQTPHSGFVVCAPADRPAAAQKRRAG
jgi:protein ImuA